MITNRKPLIIVALVSGVMITFLYAFGMFAVAGFLPPPPPTLTVDQVVSMYQQNQVSIIAGLSMAFVGTGFMLPLCIVGSVFMSEAEEGFPFFSVMQSLCAVITVLFTALPNFMWMAAAFRVERAPELTALLHDVGWIMWSTPSWGFAFQLVCVAVVGLMDKREKPFIPRWLSYLALWIAVCVSPTPLVPFFMTGPFAWDGLFSFWIAFFAPICWIIIVTFLIINNCRRNIGNDSTQTTEA